MYSFLHVKCRHFYEKNFAIVTILYRLDLKSIDITSCLRDSKGGSKSFST